MVFSELTQTNFKLVEFGPLTKENCEQVVAFQVLLQMYKCFENKKARLRF